MAPLTLKLKPSEVRSPFSAKDTMDRLEAEVKARGNTVFARVDHAAGAASVGISLRPTEALIFGNPKAGTALMQANQTIGIDLPLKALVCEDGAGAVWVAYNDPAWLAQRHGLGGTLDRNVAAIAAALKSIVDKVIQSPGSGG
jgi:uncharacterized protein (DUF302 family)